MTGSIDAKGGNVVLAAKFSASASATYTIRSSVGRFDTTANLNYRSKIYADPNNDFPLPGRTLISLNERWTSHDGNTNVTLWVNNLTDKKWNTSTALLDPQGEVGRPGEPRTYGVTIGRKF